MAAEDNHTKSELFKELISKVSALQVMFLLQNRSLEKAVGKNLLAMATLIVTQGWNRHAMVLMTRKTRPGATLK